MHREAAVLLRSVNGEINISTLVSQDAVVLIRCFSIAHSKANLFNRNDTFSITSVLFCEFNKKFVVFDYVSAMRVIHD